MQLELPALGRCVQSIRCMHDRQATTAMHHTSWMDGRILELL